MAEWQIVRCSQGAYYQSKWVPLMSFKAVRLGRQRLQRCPVHHAWQLTSRVPDSDVTPTIREEAARFRDSGII